MLAEHHEGGARPVLPAQVHLTAAERDTVTVAVRCLEARLPVDRYRQPEQVTVERERLLQFSHLNGQVREPGDPASFAHDQSMVVRKSRSPEAMSAGTAWLNSSAAFFQVIFAASSAGMSFSSSRRNGWVRGQLPSACG
jgi:hypothetical protein